MTDRLGTTLRSPSRERRFKVVTCTGWLYETRNTAHGAGTSYIVSDTANCCRTVAEFQTEDHSLRGRGRTRAMRDAMCREKAEQLAAQLNEEVYVSSAATDAHSADLATNDLGPVCPSCHDLSAVGGQWCESCGTWLLDRGPTATELAEHAALRREDTQPTKGTEA